MKLAFEGSGILLLDDVHGSFLGSFFQSSRTASVPLLGPTNTAQSNSGALVMLLCQHLGASDRGFLRRDRIRRAGSDHDFDLK